MPPAIPDRWIPYKAFGSVIEGTRLICFKVPLRKGVQIQHSDIKEIWDIQTLLQKIPKLGAVIDLTNTARYYNPSEFQAAGVLHKKIMMPGRIIPPESSVKEFMDTVDEFLGKDCVAVQVRRNRRGLTASDVLVGVHCTHGLNRTGYMVCRYMRDRLRIPAKDAIKKFQKARGYEIERANYLADLLGQKPPPPDVGKRTIVKPLTRRDSVTYQSPLSKGDEDTDGRSRYGPKYGRYEREHNWRDREDRSYRNGPSSTNWRHRDSDNNSSVRKIRKSSDSFDYKFDY